MQCNIILPNEEFHFISFLFSRRLASGLQRCRRQAILAMVFIWVIIPWNCQNKSLFLKTDAMKKLRTHLSFTQLRFHCSKNKGRTLHLTTAANSSGEAVVQYFSGQTDANPKACGSFLRLNDDNSRLAADCYQWGNKQWGYSFKEKKEKSIRCSGPRKISLVFKRELKMGMWRLHLQWCRIFWIVHRWLLEGFCSLRPNTTST